MFFHRLLPFTAINIFLVEREKLKIMHQVRRKNAVFEIVSALNDSSNEEIKKNLRYPKSRKLCMQRQPSLLSYFRLFVANHESQIVVD